MMASPAAHQSKRARITNRIPAPHDKNDLDTLISIYRERHNPTLLVNSYIQVYGDTPIGMWDVSRVTRMDNLFAQYPDFNENINDWDVSNVITMEGMFKGCHQYNQPMDKWNTRKVCSTSCMFLRAVSFNQPLEQWDVSKLSYADSMFRECTEFNQPLNGWGARTGKMSNVSWMFRHCTSFNQPLDQWDTKCFSRADGMFEYCTAFNQPLDSWKMRYLESSVGNMLAYCPSYQQSCLRWTWMHDRVIQENVFKGNDHLVAQFNRAAMLVQYWNDYPDGTTEQFRFFIIEKMLFDDAVSVMTQSSGNLPADDKNSWANHKRRLLKFAKNHSFVDLFNDLPIYGSSVSVDGPMSHFLCVDALPILKYYKNTHERLIGNEFDGTAQAYRDLCRMVNLYFGLTEGLEKVEMVTRRMHVSSDLILHMLKYIIGDWELYPQPLRIFATELIVGVCFPENDTNMKPGTMSLVRDLRKIQVERREKQKKPLRKPSVFYICRR